MRHLIQQFRTCLPTDSVASDGERSARRAFLYGGCVVLLVFGWPLWDLLRLSIGNSFYSHLPLLPFISLYVYGQLGVVIRYRTERPRPVSIVTAIASLALLLVWVARKAGCIGLPRDEALALAIAGVLFAVATLALAFFTRETLRASVAPLGFLLFLIPLPNGVVEAIEVFLQHGSAQAAGLLFQLSSTPALHNGLVFDLPGISLQVAPECSGIRSSLVLFITSILAGVLFLGRPWKIAILAGAVIPLGILRNGFRIFVIGELCARIGPEMIKSWIHHSGGPIFFVLSLIPLFALLWFLKWFGSKKQPTTSNNLSR